MPEGIKLKLSGDIEVIQNALCASRFPKDSIYNMYGSDKGIRLKL